MKHAVISTTYDDKYFWYLPIVTWVWNKMGYNVICFMPYSNYLGSEAKNQVPSQIVRDTLNRQNLNYNIEYFECPENKKPTYAQCSRLYASALDLPEDDVLVVSDIDMFVFNPSYFHEPPAGIIDIYGADLVPPNQYPMCYLVGQVKTWRDLIGEGSPQEHLDRELGNINSLSMRSDYWAKDQELAYNMLQSNDEVDYRLFNRARPGTQFATNRLDRDDSFILERLSPDIVDYHANRPGYEPHNFSVIMSILDYYFPHEDLSWIEEYNEKYKQLL